MRPAVGEGRPRRVRSGQDVLRLLVALVLLVLVVAFVLVATQTTAGVAEDVEDVWARVPRILVLVVDVGGLLALLALLVGIVAEHLLRPARWALGTAFGAAVVAGGLVALLGAWADAAGAPVLGDVIDLGGDSVAASAVVLVTFLTAADLPSLRWRTVASAVVLLVLVPAVAVGALDPSAAVIALLAGRVLGLTARLLAGVRAGPSPEVLAATALARAGLPAVTVRAGESRIGVRALVAELPDGTVLDVAIVDRDTQTTGLVRRAWRLLRYRSAIAGRAAVSPRGVVEREALASYAAADAGVDVPAVRALLPLGPDAFLLARDARPGVALDALDDLSDDGVSDDVLDAAWDSVRRLHMARVAHRGLVAEAIRVRDDGSVALADLDEAAVGAGDVVLRLDVIHLLVTLALLVGPDRAVASARRVLAADVLPAAAGLLQPVALPPMLRRRLGAHEDLLGALQERALPEQAVAAPAESLERLRPRTVLTVVAGTAAAYVLATQLGSIDLVGTVRAAEPLWALIAVVGSALTYVGAAVALQAFTPARLVYLRTIGVQLAASFVVLVTPPAVGLVTLNLRYLRRAGVPPVASATVVAITQLSSLAVTIVLLVGLGLLTGTSRGPSLVPAGVALTAVGVVAGLALLVAAVPSLRRLAAERVVARFRESLPRLLELLRQPGRLVLGLAGNLGVTAGYVLALDASLRAFGVELGLAQTAIAYLAGGAVGSAAPTPGGLGAVEAATVAALAAAGVPGSLAVPAVLLFRVATFWLPVLPGWIAFTALQRRGAV